MDSNLDGTSSETDRRSQSSTSAGTTAVSFDNHAEDSPVAHMGSDSEPERSSNVCWSPVCCKSASDHAWTVGSSINYYYYVVCSYRIYVTLNYNKGSVPSISSGSCV